MQQLTAVARDAAGTTLAGRSPTWVSSAPSIATVSTSGLVTAVSPGRATVNATVEGNSANAEVIVSSSVDGVLYQSRNWDGVQPSSTAAAYLSAIDSPRFHRFRQERDSCALAQMPALAWHGRWMAFPGRCT